MTIESFTTGTDDYGRWMKVLLVGYPGAGKTLMSSTFPDPYYASAEGGLMSVADRGVRGTKITSSDQLFELGKILRQDSAVRTEMLGIKGPINTVVLDTIDEIQQIFVKERLVSEKLPALRPLDYGWLGEQMKALIKGYRNLDMHVVFTCHMKDSKDDENGRIIYKPGLVGSTCDYLPGAVDLSLMVVAESKLKVVAKETQQVLERWLVSYPDAGHPWIKDRSGKLPPRFEVNFEDDYARIEALIFGAPTVIQPPSSNDGGATGAVNPAFALVEPAHRCVDCDAVVDEEQATLSQLRLRKVLCKKHYQTDNKKEKVETNG